MKKHNQLCALGTLLIGLSSSTLLVHAEEVRYTSNGATEFIQGGGPTKPLYPEGPYVDPMKPVEPIDPTNPGGEPNPGTTGPLTIDYASSWDYGKLKISSKDERYNPNLVSLKDGREVLPYVQVSDFRGTNSGWSLYVKQESQFHNSTLTHSELTGADIRVSGASFLGSTVPDWLDYPSSPYSTNGDLTPGGGNIPVMMAPKGTGGMTWIRPFGIEPEYVNGIGKSDGLELTIPGKTPKDAGKYTTELTWTLMDVPAPERPPIDPTR